MHTANLLASLGFVFAIALSGHAAAQSSRYYTFEQNVDLPGLDYSNSASKSAEECSFRCQAEGNRCRALTYVRPGVQGPSGRCWLKTDTPRAAQNNCCISGVRKGDRSKGL